MSSKAPDLCIIPNHPEPFQPTVVVETGWSETSWPALVDDAKLWLLGGQPYVQMVITICWSNDDGRIKGGLKVYERDASGNSIEKQTEVSMSCLVERLQAKTCIQSIFPAPANAATQTIAVTRGQIFGNGILPGRNAAGIWELSIDKLRAVTEPCIRVMGYTPFLD